MRTMLSFSSWALGLATVLFTVTTAGELHAQANTASQTFRLYHGVTIYVHNPDGRQFDVGLDLRDINVYANGPREVLLKIYDPDGQAVAREIIPDDGVVSQSYLPPIGGWDHELDYYALCRSRGTTPMIRWSAWSDPKRLATIVPRTFNRKVSAGKKGIYRIVLVGERDHYATLKLDRELKYAVCGHHTFLHGHGDQWKRSFIYVPRGTTGLHLAFAEPDAPQTHRFTLSAPDGSKLFDGSAAGSFVTQTIAFDKPGKYDDQLLTLDVSDGANDYLLKVTLQRAGGDYVGMGTEALLAPDEATARALRGGAIYEDGQVFWHPFQVRFHKWLAANKQNEKQHSELSQLANAMQMIGPSDGRGSKTWCNWAYAFGYYGCRIWRPGWLLMKRGDVPAEAKQLIREAFLIGGDRLSFAIGIERVNGNAFSQIAVALWYCHQATGDALQKQRFETWFERWRTGGWGTGVGLGKSGDSQEHFAHDANYGWYILENWKGGTWVENGILDDTNDPWFREVFERIRNLYSYISCRDAAANPWSSRTHSGTARQWQTGGKDNTWKGDPGPDFTVNVNDGSEWFAARRKNYYMLTFHGQLAPEWLSNTFHGQIGFGGGVLCQLTVPGKGTVLASTLHESYGKGMHLSNWRNFHIHSVVGEMWDGQPLVTGVSEHDDARLEKNVVSSSGEVRGRPVITSRQYTYQSDRVACEVKLRATPDNHLLKLWSGDRPLSHVREAYEMIPFLAATVTIERPDGGSEKLTAKATEAKAVVIDRGGYGVRVAFDKPMKVLLGAKNTLLIELVPPSEKPVDVSNLSLRYELMPFSKG